MELGRSIFRKEHLALNNFKVHIQFSKCLLILLLCKEATEKSLRTLRPTSSITTSTWTTTHRNTPLSFLTVSLPLHRRTGCLVP